MGAQGFSRHIIEVLKSNRAMLPSQNWEKSKSGKNIDGKKPVRFKKASKATKKVIYKDKLKIEKQIKFRIGLVITIVVFVFLFLILIFH